MIIVVWFMLLFPFWCVYACNLVNSKYYIGSHNAELFMISATRVRQAEHFNNPQSKYNILVATDAIGMGLNL